MWSSRSKELEILDLSPDHYSAEEYEECLFQLDRIGRWLGGDTATVKALKRMQETPGSILDVGCGGGLFACRIAKRYVSARLLGIDLNERAIAFAERMRKQSNIAFEMRTSEALNEPHKSFDVVMTTLVCHHMTDQAFIEFLKKSCEIARKKVIINDLHRHPIAFYLFKLISPVLFRNRLVLNDGPLSILRGFTRKELASCLAAAGIPPEQYTIRWQWAFRWIVEINCEGRDDG